MTARLSLVVLVAATAVASAEPRIVLVEGTGPALPALGTQIELHGGQIALDTVREAAPGERAAAILAERDATMIVWIEPAADGRFAAISIDRAGTRSELVTFAAGIPAADVERMIALKLVGVLDLAPRPPEPAAHWVISFGAKLVAGDDRGAAGGPAIAVERELPRRGRWRFAAGVQGRWLRSGQIEMPGVHVGVDELGLAARVEAGPAWKLAPFASAAIAGVYYRASATRMDGRTGAEGELVPSLEPGVGVRMTAGAVQLTLQLSLQHALIRQRFLVDREVVADLARDRAALSFGISLPLR